MGHTQTPLPKCTLHMYAQIVAHEVDGPPVQPSTQHLYTLLMPPNWRWRGCMWVGRASSEAGETASSTCFTSFAEGSEALGTAPLGSWGDGTGDSGRWSVTNFSYKGVGLRIQRDAIKLPSGACRDLPCLNLPLPLQSSSTLPFLCIELLPPIDGSLPSRNLPSLTCLAPRNETQRQRCEM